MRMNSGRKNARQKLAVLCAILSLALPGLVSAKESDSSANVWDVSQPRGKTRDIDFKTDEGTWMSVALSPDGSWIVFDMLGHIYRIPATGGEAVPITQDSGIAMNYHPRISPDGTEIAFISDRGGQDNLWVMKSDGSEPRLIAADMDARYAEPSWTPDSKHIVVTKRAKTEAGFYRTSDSLWIFPREGGIGGPLVVLGASGGEAPARTGLWSGNYRAQAASVSPDGASVYFVSSTFTGNDRRLRRLDMKSKRIEDVTQSKNGFFACCGRPAYPAHLLEVAPEISPDGRYLAFARRLPSAVLAYRDKELNARTTLWIRDMKSGEERLVMDPISNTLAELHPAWQTRTLPGYSWSADGLYIVISQGGKIRRLEVATGKVETIPFTAHVRRTISEQARGHVSIEDTSFKARALRWPAISPNGDAVVFEAVGKIWLKSLPDGDLKPLTAEMRGAFQMTPSWSHDGTEIAFTSWSDAEGGALWKVSRDGGAPLRLSIDAGRYFYASWNNDDAAVKANFWPASLDYNSFDSTQWRLISAPASGGEAKRSSPPALPEVVSHDSRGGYWVQLADKLAFASTPEATPTPIASVSGAATGAQVFPSPDGKWVAVWQYNDIYLLPMPQNRGSDLPVIDAIKSGKRLSLEGGYYPTWRDSTHLTFASASAVFSYDLNSRELTKYGINLSIDRDAIAHGAVALTDARIITLDNRSVIKRGSVVVRDGRIACVGKCSLDGVEERISAKGKTIIPGLIDTHAHSLSDEYLDGIIPQHRSSSAAYLAYGVTTIFDPATFGILHTFSIGELIEAGRVVGPRTYSTGTSLTCGAASDVRDIDSFEEAQHQINRLANYGVISIKDYKQCTRLQRTWVAEAARERDVSLTSEGSDYNYLLGLIMTGHAGFEHAIQVKPTYKDFAMFMAQAGAHYSPQITPGGDYPEGAPLEYWLGQRDLWFDSKIMRWNPWQEIAERRTYVKKPLNDYGMMLQSETSKDIKRAGGYVATGAHGEMGGIDTHWEMWIHALSMTPMEALEATSHDGAHFLGLENELGSISVGKLADLVVLNSNPLDDIKNTLDIKYVMKAGRLYEGETLDEIWPTHRAYGPRPWTKESMTPTDVKPDNLWDQ